MLCCIHIDKASRRRADPGKRAINIVFEIECRLLIFQTTILSTFPTSSRILLRHL